MKNESSARQRIHMRKNQALFSSKDKRKNSDVVCWRFKGSDNYVIVAFREDIGNLQN